MTKVWDGYPGGGTALLALLALADWSDDEGRCYPSISSIAKKIRLKERQAQRAVHSLLKDGYVKVIGNMFGGPPGATRQYQIIIANLTGVILDTPMQETGVMQDADGCHLGYETGVADDTQTVIEPSLTVRHSAKVKITLSPNGDFENIDPYIRVWESAYPSIDVRAQIREVAAWCISNPAKAPRSNYSRFINGWLSRSKSVGTLGLMDGVL